jgi:hypothetical protein
LNILHSQASKILALHHFWKLGLGHELILLDGSLHICPLPLLVSCRQVNLLCRCLYPNRSRKDRLSLATLYVLDMHVKAEKTLNMGDMGGLLMPSLATWLGKGKASAVRANESHA